jgi:protein-disulfide isomerase
MSWSLQKLGALSLLIVTIVAACQKAAPVKSDTMAAAVAHVEGDSAAPIKFIYFDDLVCDDCRQFSANAAEPIRTQWVATKKLQLTVIDLAWHRGSVAGSAATVCAAEQGKWWEMHERLFERQDTWKRTVDIPATLQGYAAELGLDTARYARCAASKDHQRRLDAADDAARQTGVRGTPAFVVNGKPYFGAQDWGWMEQVLKAYEAGKPENAPPPPLAVPTKKVVDSARLKQLQDSAAKARGK